MSTPAPRPKFLDLGKVRLPVTGLVSISHRLTGFLLFLSLPLAVALFELSLQGPDAYAHAQALLATQPVRLLLVLNLWWFVHHLLAGARFLALDAEWGISLAAARRSAYGVFALSAAALIALGMALL